MLSGGGQGCQDRGQAGYCAAGTRTHGIHLRDVVSYTAADYLVEGLISYRLGKRKRVLARLVDGERVLWMDPLPDEIDERVLFLEEVHDPRHDRTTAGQHLVQGANLPARVRGSGRGGDQRTDAGARVGDLRGVALSRSGRYLHPNRGVARQPDRFGWPLGPPGHATNTARKVREETAMYKLVLLRHGESTWNKENRFTGWTDVDLSEKGRQEAKTGAQALKDGGYIFDVAYTSVLKRAIRTLGCVLDTLDLMWIPVHRSWRLNERHYGALQGLNKSETAAKYGEAQVKIWRRSYDIPPPPLEKTDPRFPGNDPRATKISTAAELPQTECLKDTVARFLPLWHETIAPVVKSGKRVIIAAHGNSLRALVKYLDNIPESEIVELNIPTGIPLVYELDANLKPIKHYYLGDQAAIAAAMKAVANQGKAK